jgi:Na+/proline symporter
MSWIDWLIVLIPLIVVAGIAVKAQRYVKGVSDFVAAGRVAGRYVLSIASGEASKGLITLVAAFEVYYSSGFAYGFWEGFNIPIVVLVSLTGYCVYRFRETRALTMGQFLELRYSRSFRIFAAILQSISGIINYAIFPAVGSRFLVYFCDLPVEINLFGWVFPTFALIMALFLFVAVLITTMGGQITVMVTDCVQGIISYPLYAIIVIYLFCRFSWFTDMAPALLDRPAGKSLLNPYDIENLRDFNLFYIVVGIVSGMLNKMSWSGTQGYNAAALNAHEQKIGGILGAWRYGFLTMMIMLLAAAAYTFLNSRDFRDGDTGSNACRNELALDVFDDVGRDKEFDTVRTEFGNYVATGDISESLQAAIAASRLNKQDEEKEGPLDASEDNVDEEPVLTVGKKAMGTVSPGKARVYEAIFGQMRVPMALRYMLPIGITGIFCALCIFMLISTDTTYMHSWGCILIQDIVLPVRGRPFTPRGQLRLLRVAIVFVALFAFVFSYFFGQVDYILMYFAITAAIWLGGAGPCIVGGLYWKRGTSTGAWAALISGSSLAVCGILGQQLWPETIYPWLAQSGSLETVTRIVEGASAPFEPFVVWRITADKFPINSQEIYAITLIVTISLYIGLSLLTCRKPFNMDRLLHRGKYQREGMRIEKEPLTVKRALLKLLGITPEYTRGDKAIAWSVFIYTFGWTFLVCFVVVLTWNTIKAWNNENWATWFFINYLVVGSLLALVSTVWFFIGGTWDLRRLFRNLRAKESNDLDDGRVIDHVSTDDIALVEKVEGTPPGKTEEADGST